MPGLSFITLLAYDYRYSYAAIRSYYDLADEIILGLDVDRLTFMKQPFAIDMNEMRAFITDVDRQKKIRIFEANFHAADTAMANDLIERSLLSQQVAPGNWVVQIDADEILLNGSEFKSWLLQNDPAEHNVYARWISVFKVFGDQVLLIDPPGEAAPVATMLRGQYTCGRVTDQQPVMSPLRMLHFSWGRTPQQLLQKLQNWGHTQDFDTRPFFDFWNSVTLQNFTAASNFHPLHGPTWQSLKQVPIDFRPGEYDSALGRAALTDDPVLEHQVIEARA